VKSRCGIKVICGGLKQNRNLNFNEINIHHSLQIVHVELLTLNMKDVIINKTFTLEKM